MSRKPKFPEEAKTKPGRGRRQAATTPPRLQGNAAVARRNASEAPTEPPPPLDEAVEVVVPKGGKVSGVRPKRGASAATVDEVTADLTKDPRRED